MDLSNALISKHPTALIDVATGDVRHTALHCHAARRHEALRAQLDALWRGKKDDAASSPRCVFVCVCV